MITSGAPGSASRNPASTGDIAQAGVGSSVCREIRRCPGTLPRALLAQQAPLPRQKIQSAPHSDAADPRFRGQATPAGQGLLPRRC